MADESGHKKEVETTEVSMIRWIFDTP